MRLRSSVLVAVSVVVLAACSGASEPAKFVPGEPITYPVSTDGIHEHLGQIMINLCHEDADPNDPDCVLRVKERMKSCRGDVPPVYETEKEYKAAAQKYLYCIDRL